MGVLGKLVKKFFDWYQRFYTLNVGLASLLFVWQLVHLLWLFFHVIWVKLFGYSLIDFSGFLNYLIMVVDYTEIPALITTSLIYINDFRKTKAFRNFVFLFLLNIQWLHLFWITDEFVISQFSGEETILPIWLAWIAILIDYLELTVMFDTLKRFLKAVSGKVGN